MPCLSLTYLYKTSIKYFFKKKQSLYYILYNFFVIYKYYFNFMFKNMDF